MQKLINQVREKAKSGEGFSLVELAVVALVMLALLAIALPTFLGAQDGANDRKAQTNLRTALTNADVIRAEEGGPTYAAVTNASLAAVEPGVTFVAAAAVSTDADSSVSVQGDATSFRAASLSKSGKCFTILKVTSGAGMGTFYGDTLAAADCSADEVTGGVGGNTTAARW